MNYLKIRADNPILFRVFIYICKENWPTTLLFATGFAMKVISETVFLLFLVLVGAQFVKCKGYYYAFMELGLHSC
jgi:hypothetical protein